MGTQKPLDSIFNTSCLDKRFIKILNFLVFHHSLEIQGDVMSMTLM